MLSHVGFTAFPTGTSGGYLQQDRASCCPGPSQLPTISANNAPSAPHQACPYCSGSTQKPWVPVSERECHPAACGTWFVRGQSHCFHYSEPFTSSRHIQCQHPVPSDSSVPRVSDHSNDASGRTDPDHPRNQPGHHHLTCHSSGCHTGPASSGPGTGIPAEDGGDQAILSEAAAE